MKIEDAIPEEYLRVDLVLDVRYRSQRWIQINQSKYGGHIWFAKRGVFDYLTDICRYLVRVISEAIARFRIDVPTATYRAQQQSRGPAATACFRADENQHRLPSVVFDCPGGPIPELHSESSRLFCSRSPYQQSLRDAEATPGVLWRGPEVTRGLEIGVGVGEMCIPEHSP
ncbi:MAG: hypothetical protein M1839_002108 [Geoglossum umbratile]|nr:MAG: hypothetical protein M1839_002108 [Geoglossum umbratile]